MYITSRYSFLFFFSSRRRHTRLVSDWSSDVCSSDLQHLDPVERDGLNDVDLRLATRATHLDPAAQTVTLDGVEVLHYDKLLLTTGSRVRSEERRVGKEGRSRGWPDP